MKFYYFLGRVLRPFAVVFLYLFCVLTKTPRVRVIMYNERDELLMVQTWLSGDHWSFPGGGVDRGEPYEAAARRELREETGIIISEDRLERCGTIHTWGHDEILFTARVMSSDLPATLPNRFEIKKAAWIADPAVLALGSLARQIVAGMAIKR